MCRALMWSSTRLASFFIPPKPGTACISEDHKAVPRTSWHRRGASWPRAIRSAVAESAGLLDPELWGRA